MEQRKVKIPPTPSGRTMRAFVFEGAMGRGLPPPGVDTLGTALRRHACPERHCDIEPALVAKQ